MLGEYSLTYKKFIYKGVEFVAYEDDVKSIMDYIQYIDEKEQVVLMIESGVLGVADVE